MSAGRVVALLVAGLALVGFAMWVASQRHLERATLAGDLVLPDLEHHVNAVTEVALRKADGDRKSTRLNSSHSQISYAVFCLKKKNDTCGGMVGNMEGRVHLAH